LKKCSRSHGLLSSVDKVEARCRKESPLTLNKERQRRALRNPIHMRVMRGRDGQKICQGFLGQKNKQNTYTHAITSLFFVLWNFWVFMFFLFSIIQPKIFSNRK